MSVAGHRVVVDSIGTAGAAVVGALKPASVLSEAELAARLYQAPSELFTGLTEEVAVEIQSMLQTTGLHSRVLGPDETFVSGDPKYEVAVVVRDPSRMTELMRLVMELLGVGAATARKLLCTSPTVLVGRISANTVDALRARFAELGAELDVSSPDDAAFDVFVGELSASDRGALTRILKDLDLPQEDAPAAADTPLLCHGLSREDADRFWERCGRHRYPVRIVNRDFERFDLRLDAAPATPEFVDWLTSSTGMPEKVAHRVLGALPVVIHQNISFRDLGRYMQEVAALGGAASGHLLVFQSFGLDIGKVGDAAVASKLLTALGGMDEATAQEALRRTRRVPGPLTSPQARWLVAELKRAGTEASLRLLD